MIKRLFAFVKKIINKIFGKKDYREIYKPISESSYLQSQCHKPKHSKAKRWIVLVIIYSFTLSIAYNILLIRECAELKENLEFVLEEAQRLNDENQQMIDTLAKPQVKQEFKRVEIKKEKGKYVEKYSIEPK